MRSKWLFILVAFLSITPAFSQASAVKEYIKKHPEGNSFFFYQSVLRVLHSDGKNNDSDYNKLIKELDYIRFFYLSDSTDLGGLSEDFLPRIKAEGYEDLMELRESGFRIRLYMKGEGQEAEFMGVVAESTFLLIFEMEGKPNLKYINTLSDLNLSKVKNIIPSNIDFNIN